MYIPPTYPTQPNQGWQAFLRNYSVQGTDSGRKQLRGAGVLDTAWKGRDHNQQAESGGRE